MRETSREPKCVIISAGSFTPVDIALYDGDFCIACDAGFKYAQDLGILPDLIVGDFDSAGEMGPEFMSGIAEIAESDPERILKLEVRKDDTDTMKAVKIGLSRGFKKFFLYGALGGRRLDHTLANIQTLLFIKHQGAKGYIMDSDRMLMVAENETVNFNVGNTGYISVFSLSEVSKGVSLKGLMYNLEDGELKNDFPLGISNEFIIDEEAVITVKEGTLLIVLEFNG
jgi:thiamine pyrophosphokinase